MRKHKTILLAALAALPALEGWAQADYLTGRLLDERADPLAAGTVVLLNPADSTMEFFAITGGSGDFAIRNIREGSYLLQASFIGFRSFYARLMVPREGGPDLGDILLSPMPVSLEGAEVVGEAVPLQINGDTVVYNAAAFKIHPGEMTEDLLKKLPGVEVDRAGNIKALGEDVNRLYVNGKEFFGSDPTVATRNIPADAIDRVKIYDKRSEGSEFTGIDDGQRDKAVNLELREDHQSGIFGDVSAGVGTGLKYKGGAKAFRFTDRTQFAALGMVNNVNEYGFSFGDYLNFRGGMRAMGTGTGTARIRLGNGNGPPVNFGQPVDGLTTSGAGGLNLSYSTSAHNRTYISYLLDGSRKDLSRQTRTERYTDNGSFMTEEESSSLNNDMAHRFNFGVRRRVDSTHNFILSGDAALMDNQLENHGETRNLKGEQIASSLLSGQGIQSGRISGNTTASYFRLFGRKSAVLRLSAEGSFTRNLEEILTDDRTVVAGDTGQGNISRFRNDRQNNASLEMTASFTRRIKKHFYLVPEATAGGMRESLDRMYGPAVNGHEPVDTLSPAFEKSYRWVRGGIRMKWNTGKSQLSAGLTGQTGTMETALWETEYSHIRLLHFVPDLSWDYEPKAGRKISLNYSTSVNTPTVSQLVPVVNLLDPLNIYYGNPELEPEYSHRFMAHFIFFDQFSFTSLMMALSGRYTTGKINWSTTVGEDLVQVNTLTNVDRDFLGRFNLDFTTPVRKLGTKIHVTAEEEWNHGINLVNGLDNLYTTIRQDYSLSAGNRKKKKWDVESGFGMILTQTSYEIRESLNSRYFDLSWFADLNYNPNNRWNFSFTADITNYSDPGFGERINVPLLRAGIDFYFLAHNRGVLSLSGHDLLDRNQNVQRISELNYLRETRTNTIGRYVMLSFKYRLNKFAREGGLDVDVQTRHR